MSTSSDGRLTATIDVGTASIRVAVDFSGVTAVNGKPCRVTVSRSDGTVVRGLDAVPAPSGIAYGIDHETPLAQVVSYTASVTDWQGSSVLATSTAASTAVDHPAATAWLKCLTVPSASRVIRVHQYPDWQADIAQGVFYALGRPDAVVVSDVRQAATGTLAVATLTPATEADLLALLTQPGPYLLQCSTESTEPDRYVAVGTLTKARVALPSMIARRVWSLPLVEVARPATANSKVVIPGHTYADSKRRWPTYADRTGAYGDRLTA